MGVLKVLVSVLLILGVVGGGVMGVRWMGERNTQTASATKEVSNQEGEIRECKARLARFHAAWKRYRAEHKNADPPSIEAFIPRYVRSAAEFVCPTAVRWTKGGGIVGQGTIQVGEKSFPETYGFKWMAAGYNRVSAKQGGKAPLVLCEIHREVLYRAAYRKAPPIGSFDTASVGGLVEPVAKAPVLAVRKNGEVGALDPSEL